MKPTARVLVGAAHAGSPSLQLFQAMTGTTAERVITWFGEGITAITMPVNDPQPPVKVRRPAPALPQRQASLPEHKMQSDRTAQGGDGQREDSSRRRTAMDVRNLLHQTTQRLIQEQHSHEQQAASGSSDSSVLTHDVERNARMDTVKR